MGPGLKCNNKEDNARWASAARRDAEVTRLQNELQLCNMRLSQMQARLIATLDEQDALRDAHKRELKAEVRAKEKLSEKLDRYLEEVKKAEAERDEMREVMSILVERVEKSNDYSAWPYSRMSLARPLEPYRGTGHAIRKQEQHGLDVNIALLESTQKQLESERRAHTHMKEEASAEILRLKAMVARRDAELEACATHSGHRVLLTSSYSTILGSGCDHPSCPYRRTCTDVGMTARPSHLQRGAPEGEEDHIFVQARSRNRALEREVEFLKDELLTERTQRFRAISLDIESGHAATTATMALQSSGEPHSLARFSTFPESAAATLPPSPLLQPRAVSSSPSHCSLNPSNTLTPPRAPEPSTGIETATASGNAYPGLDLDSLKEKIDLFSEGISTFSAERNALKKMLAEVLPRGQHEETTPGPAPIDIPAHQDLEAQVVNVVLPVKHDECTRETRALRQELDKFARESAQRERALQTEIRTLRHALVNLPGARPHERKREDEDTEETRCGPGDLKVPSPLSRVSPLIPPASRASGTEPIQEASVTHVANVDGTPNVKEAREEEGNLRLPLVEPSDGGSELDEQSMELATPLYPTILSLADDDLDLPLIPRTVHSPPKAFADIDPADIPLPTSPDGFPTSPPPFVFLSPPASTSTPPPISSSRQLPTSAQSISPPLPDLLLSSPPTPFEPPYVTSDLFARVESAALAHVDVIEREFAETQRELDAKTRELEEREAALVVLRRSTPHIHQESHQTRDARDSETDAEA